MTDDAKKKLGMLLGAALLVVLIVFAAASVRSNSHRNQQGPPGNTIPAAPATSAAPTTQDGGPAPGQNLNNQPSTLDPITSTKIVNAARAFVVAYQQRSYKDASPTAWVARCKPLVTPDFYATLVDQGNSDGTNWSDLVRTKSTITVVAKPNQPVVNDGQTYIGVPFSQTMTSTGSAALQYPGYLTVYYMHVGGPSGGSWLVSALGAQPPASSGN